VGDSSSFKFNFLRDVAEKKNISRCFTNACAFSKTASVV
jgi:hypothetical protein